MKNQAVVFKGLFILFLLLNLAVSSVADDKEKQTAKAKPQSKVSTSSDKTKTVVDERGNPTLRKYDPVVDSSTGESDTKGQTVKSGNE
jgi:hypothetical protein